MMAEIRKSLNILHLLFYQAKSVIICISFQKKIAIRLVLSTMLLIFIIISSITI